MGRSGGGKGREQGEGAAEEEGQGGGKESSGKEEMVVEEASTAAPPAVENGAHADLTRTPPASSSLPPSLPPSFLSDSSSSSHPSSLNGPGTARLPPPSAFAHLEQVASQHLPPPRPLSNPPSLPPSLPLVRGLADMSGYHSLEERMLRAVYRDLWERGLTIGSGGAYGADFTAYEGKSSRASIAPFPPPSVWSCTFGGLLSSPCRGSGSASLPFSLPFSLPPSFPPSPSSQATPWPSTPSPRSSSSLPPPLSRPGPSLPVSGWNKAW